MHRVSEQRFDEEEEPGALRRAREDRYSVANAPPRQERRSATSLRQHVQTPRIPEKKHERNAEDQSEDQRSPCRLSRQRRQAAPIQPSKLQLLRRHPVGKI